MNDEEYEDLSNAPEIFRDEEPAQPRRAGGQAVAAPAAGAREEMRGVGQVYKRKPIAAVVELLRRVPPAPGSTKWTILRPFKSIPPGSEYAFAIMNSVPTATNERGQPIREPHPSFEGFNSLHPEKCRMIRARIVNWQESEAYKNFLGAYKAPENGRYKGPEKGYWCQGNGVKARRFVDGQFKEITCPNKLCEFSQEGSGPRGQGTHCKPHIELVAQFNWPEGNPFPRVLFEWDSQSWNNVANIEGMFTHISDLATKIGYPVGKFPLVNLCFTMHLKERHKAKKKFPEVSFSIDDDLMKFMHGNHALAQNAEAVQQVQLEAPKHLGALPPPGYTEHDMQEAKNAALSPSRQPKNVRDSK